VKETIYHIGIEIDRLTNSIINTISGDSFQTAVLRVAKEDLKGVTKKGRLEIQLEIGSQIG
jgi:hypothetical protein